MRNENVEVVTQYNDGTGLKRSKNTVFAEKKSVGRDEFYKAYASGLSPKMVFSIDLNDFKSCYVVSGEKKFSPTHIIYEGEEFTIVREYEIGIQDIEVTVK